MNVQNLKGENGSNYITNTASHSGNWDTIQALADTVVATLVSPGMIGTLTTIPIPAGVCIYGSFTSITLTSGKVIAYQQAPQIAVNVNPPS